VSASGRKSIGYIQTFFMATTGGDSIEVQRMIIAIGIRTAERKGSCHCAEILFS